MKYIISILGLFVLVFVLIYKINYAQKPSSFDVSNQNYVRGGDFTVDGRDQKINLHDFKDNFVILYFGFASCPDVCPMSLSYLNKALKKIEFKKIKVLFISVDYKRDTPKSVDRYAKFFNDEFLGATASEKIINKITEQYGVYYKFVNLKQSEMGYTVDHTSRFFIIDKKGKVIKSLRSDEPMEIFIKELKSTVGEL